MVSLCIPTLNRYDCLLKCVESAMKGSLPPDIIYILDNGGKLKFESIPYDNIKIFTAPYNLGVAASWNSFIKYTEGGRIICNDDILFFEDSIEKLIKASTGVALYCPSNMLANGFSCFYLPDSVVNKVGMFDEQLSPGYAYFEDNDYYYRMQLVGIDLLSVADCNVEHLGSSTLKNFSSIELSRHHELFKAAKYRYKMKWGGEPGREVFKTPYGR